MKEREHYYKVQRVGYIDLACVRQDMRGKGIGARLIKEAEQILSDQDIDYCTLSVHSKNIARDVWTRLGFEEYRVDMYKKI
ncbi:MAG: GNAT family N-acetyltransferase [Nanoarchaeota archaeon]